MIAPLNKGFSNVIFFLNKKSKNKKDWQKEGEELTNRNSELSLKNIFLKYFYNLLFFISLGGGERGIRTPGTRKRTIDFESTAFDHSAISPW